jgi:hypothetical protein
LLPLSPSLVSSTDEPLLSSPLLTLVLVQLEPMSVGVHAVYNVAHMKQNSNVVVFGAGPVGLLTAAAAKGLGAARVIAVDINEARLKFAKEAGLVEYVSSSPFLSRNPYPFLLCQRLLPPRMARRRRTTPSVKLRR